MKSIAVFSILAVLAAQLGQAAPAKLEARAPVPPVVPTGKSVGGWTSIGCYQDTYDGNRQILKYYQYQQSMSFTSCSAFCNTGNFKFMGMSNGVWCYCDNQINFYNGLGYATTADKCNVAANGDPTVNGGGYWTNAMFELTTGYNADQASSSSAASASAAQSASAYSAAQSASAYSAAQSASMYSAAQSASVYSAAQSASAYSAAQSASAYSVAQSAAAYSAAQSASVYSAAKSASAYSANVAAQSASAYSAGQSASAYSAAQSASAYSAGVAAQSASAYSAAQSASAYSANIAAQSASAYSAGVAASSASAYSASSSAAAYSASSSAAAAAATVVPSPWTAASVSCVAEGTTGRALIGASTASDTMTYPNCLNFCASKGFPIAGIEYGRECYCGSALSNGASLKNPSSSCNMPCSGSATTTCGGPNALTLFVIPAQINSLRPDLTPAAAQLPAGWAVASTACIAEGTTGRALSGASTSASDMTGAKCAAFCASKGFSMAGTEYSQECYCGNALGNGASLNTPSTACSMTCAGDQSSTCGGPGALNVYVNPSIIPAATAPTPAGAVAPAKSSLPSGWSPAASPCIQEVQGRSLTGATTSLSNMTVPACLSFCQAQGFQFAGLEYGQECYCGNALVNGASLSTASQACNMACAGDATSTCGGPNAVQLYSNPSLAPVVPTIPPSNGMTSKGCVQEVVGRALTGMRVDNPNMTIDMCTAACSTAGYSMAGIEYGQECYCGNSLVNGASLSLVSGQCYMACPGNASQKCGGPDAIVLYGV